MIGGEMTPKIPTLFGLLLFLTGIGQAFELPKGWIMPTDSMFNGAWRKPSPSKYLAAATDINCDGIVDSILILQPAKGRGIGLFAFLQDSNGLYKSSLLFDSRKDAPDLKGLSEMESAKVQIGYRALFGIKTVARGRYATACGQGYRACGKNEKRNIEVACGGIDFFPFGEGGNSNFYWDKKKHKVLSALMND